MDGQDENNEVGGNVEGTRKFQGEIKVQTVARSCRIPDLRSWNTRKQRYEKLCEVETKRSCQDCVYYIGERRLLGTCEYSEVEK